jgi:hypothetical protein
MSIPLCQGVAFGERPYKLRGVHGEPVRVSQDLLSSVSFISTGTETALLHHATAFLLDHRSAIYLVTAKHVAEKFTKSPFYVRFNRKGGDSGLMPIDLGTEPEKLLCWFFHPEPSVDLAIMPFPIDLGAQDVVAVPLRSNAAVKKQSPMTDAGCGDMCHVIGLFSARAGKSRNIAVVHTGHIAAMADSKELIPVTWNGRDADLEGHLVEISNLNGLSGAPVFVRGGVELNVPINETEEITITTYKPELRLLGVWAGSWDKPTSRVQERVPVGVGIVTPAYRLLELLELPEVVENTLAWIRKSNAARLD